MKTITISDKAQYYLAFGDLRHFWQQVFRENGVMSNDVHLERQDDDHCMLCGWDTPRKCAKWKHAFEECPWGIVSCGPKEDDITFRCWAWGSAPIRP